MLAASGTSALAQKNNDKQQPKRSKAEQTDVETLLKVVDAAEAGQPAPSDVSITWDSNHFVKGQSGVTYIPFTVTVNNAPKPDAAVYIRVVDKDAAPPTPPPPPVADKDSKDKGKDKDAKNAAPPPAPSYPWSAFAFTQVPEGGKLSRAIALKPGNYDLFVAIKDKGIEQKNPPPAKVGLLRHELKVPDFNVPELVTSSIILAKSVEPMQQQLSPAQQEENPYVFGPMRIVPSQDNKFAKSSELQVVFWIYGAGEATGGKPDVQVEYNFHQKLTDGEKYFNKTAPQMLNAQTLPPEFSVAAGHQLPGSLVVPLTSFPEGDYRLEIKVTDKSNGKSITQNVNFSVSPS